MTPERWKQIAGLFEQALEVPVDERVAFVARNCGEDAEVRGEVESLLESHAQADGFIDKRSLFFADESDERDSTVLPPGQLIERYRIIREIGRGGMGSVYLAERADAQYEKRVALKLIKRGMDTDSVLRHFRNERQILASFDHPNIARLLDGGTTEEGLPYFVMEYVAGAPIDQYCEEHALSMAERLKLFREVCAAVTYAHRHTVIHRDIKPSNIVVTSGGVPKLLDFGIAKILQPGDEAEALVTMTGLRLMTPEYASPEQVRGELVSAATDVYSLGVVLYQLLTGHKPYRLKMRTPGEISRAIIEQEPLRPSAAIARSDGGAKFQNPKLLRGDLDQIVLMALRKEPERRYQSVEQFAEDIRRHLEARPVVARKDTLAYRSAKLIRRNPTLITAATACLLLALAVVWLSREQFAVPPKTPTPEKSIAVLPFGNLSDEPQNAHFASGVQEDILTALTKIADLKVISRTSTLSYSASPQRDLREIGQALGVANILEGSVRRSGNRVRVTAQLVDARTNLQLWAETYDRDLADVFAIQTEIALTIVTQLQAKLSPAEKSALEERPTHDLVAYDLYRRAKSVYGAGWNGDARGAERLVEAAGLLEQAIARDPQFFLAHCQLARTHGSLYFTGMDRTPARLAAAETAIAAASRLRPDSGELHLLRAEHLHHVLKYDEARTEVGLAQRTLPNEPRVFRWLAHLDRRQGRWDEAVRNYEKAMEFDPRDSSCLARVADIYHFQRRFVEAAAVLDRAIRLFPKEDALRVARGRIDLAWRADPRPLRETIDAIVAKDPAAPSSSWLAEFWFELGLCERDPVTIDRALAALRTDGDATAGDRFPRAWFEGLAARARGDATASQAAFASARVQAEATLHRQPGHARSWSFLGMIDAALGRKDEALQEGRRAVELFPVAEEPFGGAGDADNLAVIYAWTGETDLALEQLAAAVERPGNVHYGHLRLHPFWDPLRGDPRFEKIVASLAPRP